MDDLEKLHAQIADLQSKAKILAEKRRVPIIEEMIAKINLYGITAKELGFATESVSTEKTLKAAKVKKAVAVKYKKGNESWTGRGIKPKFIKDHIADGGKIEELLV
jgi:DNA-binding protein H-NS